MGCFQTVCLWRLIRPMARSCYILTDYDAVNAYHLRDVSRARTQRLVRVTERGEWGYHSCEARWGYH
jgi:hypothetical protein